MAITPTAPVLTTVAGLPPPDPTLPALLPIQSRELYRRRSENETEEAQWYSMDGSKGLVKPQQVQLKSMHSKQASVLVFQNKTQYPARAIWLDFEGNEVVYSVLEPKSSKRYHTYVTHPWIVREMQSGTRMLLSGRPAVVGLSTEQTVEVQPPPQLDWNLSTHCCFPEHYKSEVKALLLSHKRLEPYAAQTAFNSSSGPCPSHVLCYPGTQASLISNSAHPSLHCLHPVSPASSNMQQSAAPLGPSQAVNLRLRGALPPAGVVELYNSSDSGMLSQCVMSVCTAGHTPIADANISSEAVNFSAALHSSSPKHAVSSVVNISVWAGPSSCNSADVEVTVGHNVAASPPRAASTPPAKLAGFLSMVRHMLTPKRGGSRDTSAIATAPCASSLPMEVHSPSHGDHAAVQHNAAVDEDSWPPVTTHLGHLPSHLLVYIAELAHPPAWQTLAQPPKGRPDVKPTLMACPPTLLEAQQDPEQPADQN